MELELRPVTPDEFGAYSRTVEGTFGLIPSEDEVARWREIAELDRSLAAIVDGEIVGSAGAFSFELTMPGGAVIPAAGVTAVGVRSTHRRRGVLRAMMARQLDDIVARGESIAVLTASEAVIYGRFGYGLAASYSNWTLPTEGTVLDRPSACGGRLRLLDAEDAGKVVPGVYQRACRRHPGAVSRSESWWSLWAQRREDRDMQGRFQIVHESVGGDPDGFAAWTIRGLKEPSGVFANELVVHDLFALDDDVEAALWEHLLSIDLCRVVVAHRRPVEEPLRWRLADPRRLHVQRQADHLWLRVLDPGVALVGRTYGGEGGLVLDLTDAFRPANTGTWALEVGVDGATCRRSTLAPDLRLGVPELGAVLLGGVSVTTLSRAGRVDECTSGALARADRLFASPIPPWCGTDF